MSAALAQLVKLKNAATKRQLSTKDKSRLGGRMSLKASDHFIDYKLGLSLSWYLITSCNVARKIYKKNWLIFRQFNEVKMWRIWMIIEKLGGLPKKDFD